MRKVLGQSLVLVAAGGLLLGAGLRATADAPSTQTLVVGNTASCAGAQYLTINAAVAAASPGDTVKVCAGIYPETVQVDKSLTFLGAQAGKSGTKGRTSQKKESVVADSAGDFVIAGDVSGVTISGFTLTDANGTDTTDAIEAFQGGSGFTFTDDIISNNATGINVANPDPTQPTSITNDAFINNSAAGTGGTGGTGIFISNGPADSTTIENDSFTGDGNTAINFAGDSGNFSTGLVVVSNTSVNDATFVVADNSTNALISKNKITVNNGSNGSGILDFGSNQSLRISGNTIKGGNNSGTSGIRIASYSGTPSTGTSVTGNTITGRFNAIRVNGGYTDLFVSANKISNSSNVGILVGDGSGPGTDTADSGNVLSQNKVSSSGVYACEDDTAGTGTAGTADTWTKDKGQPSSPTGLCS